MGVCETWINDQNIEHTKSVASKSKSNGMAEVTVRVWRRLLLGDYKRISDDGKQTIRLKLNAITYGSTGATRSLGE